MCISLWKLNKYSEDGSEVGGCSDDKDNSAHNMTRGQSVINNAPSIDNEESLMGP